MHSGMSQSAVLFSTALAFILFRDERRTIRSTLYLAGCALTPGAYWSAQS